MTEARRMMGAPQTESFSYHHGEHEWDKSCGMMPTCAPIERASASVGPIERLCKDFPLLMADDTAIGAAVRKEIAAQARQIAALRAALEQDCSERRAALEEPQGEAQ